MAAPPGSAAGQMPAPPLTWKPGSMFTLAVMDGLRVSDLAGRAGLAPSTVRFYERAGLLSPARRAANGYRVFDESALEELAFISRAKGIGMSLEEIAGLVAAWPDSECQSLQARLRDFLATRISQVRAQQAELGAFERQLETVLGRLSARDPGPEHCGKGCGCEADLDASPADAGHAPWGCSLGQDALASRVSQWNAVAAAATSAGHDGDTVRLTLPAIPDMTATVAALCAAETTCCPQTRFTLELTAGQLTLTAHAPGTPDLLGTLFPAAGASS
jgi:DNA-binding transcriptional MerR regulator